MAAHPGDGLKALETEPGWKHFPSTVLAAAVLAKLHADPEKRELMFRTAVTIGDLLVREHATGYYASRLDHHRDTYMWLEAYRLLKDRLDDPRRTRWRQALLEELTPIAQDVARLQDYPLYQSPFIGTSPNHYCLWSSTVYLASKVFNKPDWEKLTAKVLHRFAAEEQSLDGYWGEHSAAGPTTGYDYVTGTGMALYWELSRDPAALEALRRSLAFHKYFTWPDGTPVETINDRNRYWAPPMWGHFGFSNFPDGRRYAEFLTSFYSPQPFSLESLGRLAQDALYWHEGPAAPIPQDEAAYVNQMHVPAGMRKSGPWTVCLSGHRQHAGADEPVLPGSSGQPQHLSQRPRADRHGREFEAPARVGNVFGALRRNRESPAPQQPPPHERCGRHTGDGVQYVLRGAEVAAAARGIAHIRRCDHSAQPERGAAACAAALSQAGPILETAAGTSVLLGEGHVALGPEQIGGWIRHNGWTLKVPSGVSLEWPVRPYNPYANAPEPGIEHAVGVLTRTLEPKSQVLSFALEAN